LDRTPTNFETFKLHLKGLKGGHSGKDINSGRANSIKLMGRLLFLMSMNVDFHIVSLSAGTADNAIPREFETLISMKSSDENLVKQIIEKFIKEVLLEYKTTDPNIQVDFVKVSANPLSYTKEFTKNIVNIIQIAPHGVVAMSPTIPNLVETSLNFASISEKGSSLVFLWSIRSSIDSSKHNVANKLKSISSLGGAQSKVFADYPGWRPDFNSPVLNVAKKAYQKLYGRDPRVVATHSGLEPGVIGSIFPKLQANMLSMGPDIIGNHSPTEKMRISSVEKTYNWLKEIVESY
jgi:dipeptidase D